MTPGARLAAAIEILDRSLSGAPTEQALTHWARTHRFAGSSDRADIRTIVFDAVRCRRSFAHLGGSADGRGLVIGGLRSAGQDPDALFDGAGYAPPPLSEAERATPPTMDRHTRLDCPDWLAPQLEASLGDRFEPVMSALRHRAPVFLRVNRAQGDRTAAAAALAAQGIQTRPAQLADTALEVVGNARRVQQSDAYLSGLVELQDAASQAVVEALPLKPGQRVLDFCAGGGGKALAMAARERLTIVAHDADPRRMTDLPARARRAGSAIRIAGRVDLPFEAPFDLVLVDAPCSGSGAWRRSPDAKWSLSPDELTRLRATQSAILDLSLRHLAPGSTLAYVTCSILTAENEDQVDDFQARHLHLKAGLRMRLDPSADGDGFFLATLRAPV